jgi:hippurate hydrolase
MKLKSLFTVFVSGWCSIAALAQVRPDDAVAQSVNHEYPSLLELYKHIHAHPELSMHEKDTAARIGKELRKAGFDVTTGVGGSGVVGVLRNGPGPTVLLRTELDALPVKEETGLPYASTATTRNDVGVEVPVMHACGHDVHMTVFVGTARLLQQMQSEWHGTLVMMGQPAEEAGDGARDMLKDGLYTRFPRPDYCLALHCSADQPAGTVGWTEGPALANVDSVDITIRGVGGHGAFPQDTKDPIVLAAETVMALQTIVSRELKPGTPAVVSVGSIHGGTTHNVIPGEVKLQLTLRSYSEEVRLQTIAAIRRITHWLGLAAGLPEDRLPVVQVLEDEFSPVMVNDPTLTRRVTQVFRTVFGESNVLHRDPVMGAEDFGQLSRTPEKVPICMFWLGTVSAESVTESQHSGKPLPSLHSGLFAPLPEPSIKTGIRAMTAAFLDLTGKK